MKYFSSCLKAIGFEYFKLARSVLKIRSFEFINLQYFNSTFKNLKIARLVLNAKCKIVVFTQCSCQWLLRDKQNIVHLVSYIYMLPSNEEISKIEKTYLEKHRQVFLVPDGQASLWQRPRPSRLFYICLSKTRVKCSGGAPGYANAQPLGLR